MVMTYIDGKGYEVHPLSEAARTFYWQRIDELAEADLNPWDDLYQKVKDLPRYLQEIVFAGAPQSIFPLSKRQMASVCCGGTAITLLCSLATAGPSPDPIECDSLQMLEIYVDLVQLLGDSYTGKSTATERTLTGLEAVAFARNLAAQKQAAAEAGKGEDDGEATVPDGPGA